MAWFETELTRFERMEPTEDISVGEQMCQAVSLTLNIVRFNFRLAWGGLSLGISVQFFSSSEKEAEGSMTFFN